MATITVGIPAGTGRLYAGPTLVTAGRGYFSQQGLDVQLVESGGRHGSLPLLTTGDLDVSPQGPSIDFFKAWDPSQPIVMVADHGSMRPGRGSGVIMARAELIRDGSLRDYSDLRGKRIALGAQRGDHDWLTFAAALRNGGLTFDDVEIVILPFGAARHEALANGTIDLATSGRLRSVLEAKESGIEAAWKYDYEVRPGRAQRVVMFSHRFSSERPDEARRYVLAYLQGLRDYYDAFEEGLNRDAIVQVLADQSGYTPQAIDEDMTPVGLDPNGQLNEKGILTLLDGDHEVTPGVTLKVTNGHSDGHQIVLIEAGSERIMYMGDLIPTPHHLPLPYIAAVDQCPNDPLDQKRKLLEMANRDGWLVIFGHGLDQRAGYIEQRNGRHRLRPVDI